MSTVISMEHNIFLSKLFKQDCLKFMTLPWKEAHKGWVIFLRVFMCYAAMITYRVADEIFGKGTSNLSKSSYITLIYINVIHSIGQAEK